MHVQDDLDLHILPMLKDTFSLDATHIMYEPNNLKRPENSITSGPSCSKQLNELVSGQNVNCSSKYNTRFTGIFAEKM